MKWFFEVLKKYAVFEGRSRRKEYWYFYLFYIILIGLIDITGGLLFNSHIPLYLTEVALIIPFLAVSVRRMHDVNKSGWYILIPIYNLILHCTKGTEGPNDYGVDPKNPEFEEF